MGIPGGLELVHVELTITRGVGSLEGLVALSFVGSALVIADSVLSAHGVEPGGDLGPRDGARVVSVEVLDEVGPDVVGIVLLASHHLEADVDTVLGGLSLELGFVNGAIARGVDPVELTLDVVLSTSALLRSCTVGSALLVNEGGQLGPLNSARAISVDVVEDLSPNLVGRGALLGLALGHGGSHRLHAEVHTMLGGFSLELGFVDGTIARGVDSVELALDVGLSVAAVFGRDIVGSAHLIDPGRELAPLNCARAIGVDVVEDFSPDLVGRWAFGGRLLGESEGGSGSSKSKESH